MHQHSTALLALNHETRSYKLFRDQLLSDLPDLDEETLADTLEGLTNSRRS